MGFYTEYRLDLIERNEDISLILDRVEKSKYPMLFKAMDENGCTQDPVIFNDTSVEIEVLRLSCDFPDKVFELRYDNVNSANVESGLDKYVYFKNGKIQTAKVRTVYDEYDESKLIKPSWSEN